MLVFSIFFVPIVLILTGILLWRIPPKNINSIYGYRTRLASRSIATWKYANDRCAKLLIIVGASGFLFVTLVYLFSYFVFKIQYSDDFWGIIILAVLIISLTIVITIIQFELKAKFDDKGKLIKRGH